jgi:hypothetical protein
MKRSMVAVCKVWEDIESEKNRVNIYYDDRIERYLDDGGLVEYDGDGQEAIIPWKGKDGKPLGIPFGHFRNRKKTRSIFGTSEVQKVIAPQDVLNRTFASMTMTAELTAFQRLAFIGMTAEADMTPGAIWEIVAKDKDGQAIAGIPNDRYVDIKVIEPGEIAPFVSQAEFTIEQISIISETPIPSMLGGDSQSGEALKQREIGLSSKVRTSQVIIGNVWEYLVLLAAKIEETFATAPPEFEDVNVVWAEASIRDTAQLVTNVMAASTVLDKRTILTELEPAMDYSIADIDEIMKRVTSEAVGAAKRERRAESVNVRNNARHAASLAAEQAVAQVEPVEVVDVTVEGEPIPAG